ncbi:MAG: hypothetical protein H0U80_01195, partial [Solirubrobacterales bacterium]|nr:hypothetical protein [Solirubrobacterales bacterium]
LITRDARARVASGAMDGPVIGTRCRIEPPTATRATLEADPAATRLPYACVALKARFELPDAEGRRRRGLFGHPYRAVVDSSSRTVVWCRLFPAPSEGASAPARISMPPACRVRVARRRGGA